MKKFFVLYSLKQKLTPTLYKTKNTVIKHVSTNKTLRYQQFETQDTAKIFIEKMIIGTQINLNKPLSQNDVKKILIGLNIDSSFSAKKLYNRQPDWQNQEDLSDTQKMQRQQKQANWTILSKDHAMRRQDNEQKYDGSYASSDKRSFEAFSSASKIKNTNKDFEEMNKKQNQQSQSQSSMLSQQLTATQDLTEQLSYAGKLDYNGQIQRSGIYKKNLKKKKSQEGDYYVVWNKNDYSILNLAKKQTGLSKLLLELEKQYSVEWVKQKITMEGFKLKRGAQILIKQLEAKKKLNVKEQSQNNISRKQINQKIILKQNIKQEQIIKQEYTLQQQQLQVQQQYGIQQQKVQQQQSKVIQLSVEQPDRVGYKQNIQKQHKKQTIIQKQKVQMSLSQTIPVTNDKQHIARTQQGSNKQKLISSINREQEQALIFKDEHKSLTSQDKHKTFFYQFKRTQQSLNNLQGQQYKSQNKQVQGTISQKQYHLKQQKTELPHIFKAKLPLSNKEKQVIDSVQLQQGKPQIDLDRNGKQSFNKDIQSSDKDIQTLNIDIQSLSKEIQAQNKDHQLVEHNAELRQQNQQFKQEHQSMKSQNQIKQDAKQFEQKNKILLQQQSNVAPKSEQPSPQKILINQQYISNNLKTQPVSQTQINNRNNLQSITQQQQQPSRPEPIQSFKPKYIHPLNKIYIRSLISNDNNQQQATNKKFIPNQQHWYQNTCTKSQKMKKQYNQQQQQEQVEIYPSLILRQSPGFSIGICEIKGSKSGKTIRRQNIILGKTKQQQGNLLALAFSLSNINKLKNRKATIHLSKQMSKCKQYSHKLDKKIVETKKFFEQIESRYKQRIHYIV